MCLFFFFFKHILAHCIIVLFYMIDELTVILKCGRDCYCRGVQTFSLVLYMIDIYKVMVSMQYVPTQVL